MAKGKKTVKDFKADKVEEIVAGDMEDMTAEYREVIYQQWIPRMYAKLLEAVRKLPREYREYVLGMQGKTCWEEFAKPIYGWKDKMTWEEFKTAVVNLPAPLGPYEFTELGNDMTLWTYQCAKDKDGRAMCWCPIAILGLLPGVRKAAGDPNPFPELCCECGTSHMINAIEQCCGKKVARFDTLCTVQTASDESHEEDRWVVHFKKVAHSKEGKTDDLPSPAKSE